jgi:biotin-(acetyl-CoA carboxylase) ligase
MQELKDDFQQKKDKYEEQAKEIARSQKQAVSEFEKEKALMKQKIEHLEKTIEDKNNREKEFTVDWRTQKTGIAQEVKAVTIKHEAEIKTLMS